MPLLSRSFIKSGMIYLLLGLLLGGIIAAQEPLNLSQNWQVYRPIFLHFIFIGWVSQLIIGVGYWMFPRYSKEQPRGNAQLGWLTFALLNIGLILRAISEPLTVLRQEAYWGWMLVISAICLVLAGWIFVFNSWGRIKER